MSGSFEVLGIMPINWDAEGARWSSPLIWKKTESVKLRAKTRAGLFVNTGNAEAAFVMRAVGRDYNHGPFDVPGDEIHAALKGLDVPDDYLDGVQAVFRLAKLAGTRLVRCR